MPRTTKAQTVLNEAQAHLNVARINVANAEHALSEAKAVLAAIQTTYDYMVHALAPKPRGKSTPAPSVEKKSSRKKDSKTDGQQSIPNIADAKASASVAKPELCGICGNEEDYLDHTGPSPTAHQFEGKKSKASAA